MTPSQNTQNTQQAQTAAQIVGQNRISSTIVLKTLSILLGIFFILLGALKISPHISRELHKDLRREYVKYSKVFPLSGWFEVKIPSKWYRRVVGGLEIWSGLLLAVVPNRTIKTIGNIILLGLMLLSIYNHYIVSDAFERLGPTLVFSFMLTGRLVVGYQIHRKEAREAAEAAASLKQD